MEQKVAASSRLGFAMRRLIIFIGYPLGGCPLGGYPRGDNLIRIGNRTRLYAVSVLDCHRHYYFPVPLFPGISISLGTKLQEFSTALLRHNL